MTLQSFIETYGYAAVFVGCLLEGETVLVLAGFAAHLGYMTMPGVIAAASLGGFVGDEAWFLAGRRFGPALFARFPRLVEARPWVLRQLARRGALLVFAMRFLVGFRMATPVVIGASGGMPLSHFSPPNAAGAIVWAVLFASAGHAFGAGFTAAIEHAKRKELAAFAILGTVVALLLVWRRHRARRAYEAPDPPADD